MQEAYKALIKAQSEMGKALKQATNPHFRKQYADLGNVQDACMGAFNANGFAVFQPTGHDELGMYVSTVLAHESGEVIQCRTPLLVDKNNMQGLGSAITYARRYGLLCMSGVAPEDDDGNASTGQQDKADDRIREDMQKLRSCENEDQLRATWTTIHTDWAGNVPPAILATKEAMKTQLKEAA